MALEPRNRQEDWYKEMIDAIGEGGGSGLPEVTSADNGKVLTVENGEWTADSNIFYVTFSYKGGRFYSDKTYAEISDAVASGREVLGIQGDYVFPYAKSSSGHTFLTLSPLPYQNLNVFLVQTNNAVIQISRQTLPTVTESDAGKVLSVNNSGVWGAQEPIGKPFIVTLTPTAADYSGTMDKTVAEINAAYEAGRKIVFRTMMSATQYMDVDCTARWHTDLTYPSFNGFILSDGTFIFAFTSATNDGTKQTYDTVLYTLTPAT